MSGSLIWICEPLTVSESVGVKLIFGCKNPQFWIDCAEIPNFENPNIMTFVLILKFGSWLCRNYEIGLIHAIFFLYYTFIIFLTLQIKMRCKVILSFFYLLYAQKHSKIYIFLKQKNCSKQILHHNVYHNITIIYIEVDRFAQ